MLWSAGNSPNAIPVSEREHRREDDRRPVHAQHQLLVICAAGAATETPLSVHEAKSEARQPAEEGERDRFREQLHDEPAARRAE